MLRRNLDARGKRLPLAVYRHHEREAITPAAT